MKVLVAVLITLALVVPTMAQLGQGYYDFENPMKLPEGEMTLADVVDILTEYNVEHQKKIVGGSYWGMTLPQSREIFISDEPDLGTRRQIVVHELYHAFYFRRGYDTGGPQGEAAIAKKTSDTLVKIFRGAEDEAGK